MGSNITKESLSGTPFSSIVPRKTSVASSSSSEFEVMATYSYDGEDNLSKLNNDLLENILAYLKFKDLLALSKTCKTLRENVQSYSLHFIQSYSRLDNLVNFFNGNILTVDERRIKPRFLSVLNDHGVNLKTALFFMNIVKRFNCDFLQRHSITEGFNFPHLGNDHYIVREFFPPLDRQVVRLKTVCWLSFKKEFPEIPKGNYIISVYFGIGQDVYWPNDTNNPGIARLKIRNENSDPPLDLVEAEFKPDYWKKIKNGQFKNSFLNGKAKVTALKGLDQWYRIEFAPIEILEESTLSFEWRDVDNPWWKQGMFWDCVEIKSLN